MIIPAHWELIRAKKAGREPDPAPGIAAKQRSVHNNYLTLPVLFTMLAGHFPFTYGAEHAWLVLVALMALGALVRHFFNLRHAGRTLWWIPVGGGARDRRARDRDPPDDARSPAGAPTVSFAQVAADRRSSAARRATREPDAAWLAAPPGIELDTPEEIDGPGRRRSSAGRRSRRRCRSGT